MTGALDRAVQVMDRLRSPGGCPWDAAQDHRSLARYLLEETYEVLEAIETDDPLLLREELGDLLLQVLFHSRLAQELPTPQAFGIEEVAADLVDKLIRRHPHVFPAGAAGTVGSPPGRRATPPSQAQVDRPPEQQAALPSEESWQRLKAAEKGRTSVVDGVPVAQPALALAAAYVSRARRTGLPLPSVEPTGDVGAELLAAVTRATLAGVDAESALRIATHSYREQVLAVEREEVSRPVTRGESPTGTAIP